MTPDEIKNIIETTIHDSTKTYWIYLVISIPLTIIVVYGIEYFKTKGQNLATKQDVEIITAKIGQVKADIQNNQEIEKQKRELKYNALLNSLNLIDAHLSHHSPANGQLKITKQYASAEEARNCHNNLILSCDNTETLDLFSRIMFGPKESERDTIPPTTLLNRYRNMVRKELGFGSEIQLDEKRAWVAKVIFEKDK